VYPSSTLADLHDPLTMPAPLLRAHQDMVRWPSAGGEIQKIAKK